MNTKICTSKLFTGILVLILLPSIIYGAAKIVYTPNDSTIWTNGFLGYNCHRFAFNVSVVESIPDSVITDPEGMSIDTTGGYMTNDSVHVYSSDGDASNLGVASYVTTDSLYATHVLMDVDDPNTDNGHSARRLRSNLGTTPTLWVGKNNLAAIRTTGRRIGYDFDYDVSNIRYFRQPWKHNDSTISNDTTWVEGVHILECDVTVSNATLTLTGDVYLNGHYLRTTGSGSVSDWGKIQDEKIERKSGSTMLGLYDSLSVAVDHLSSGETVYLLQSKSVLVNSLLTIGNNETLELKGSSDIEMTSSSAGIKIQSGGILTTPSTTPATLTKSSGTWAGIELESGHSTTTIGKLEIDHAATGISIASGTVTIDSCKITDGTDGISISGGTITIQNGTVIEDNSGAGINISGGSLTINGSTTPVEILSNAYGIVASNYAGVTVYKTLIQDNDIMAVQITGVASMDFMKPTSDYDGDCSIRTTATLNVDTLISVGAYSDVTLGYNLGNGGDNTVYTYSSSDILLAAYTGSWVQAEQCYWGAWPPPGDSRFYEADGDDENLARGYSLSSDTNTGLYKSAVAGSDPDPVRALYYASLRNWLQGESRAALDGYRKIVTEYVDHKLAPHALKRLYLYQTGDALNEYIAFAAETIRKNPAFESLARSLLVAALTDAGATDQARALGDQLVQTDSPLTPFVLYRLFAATSNQGNTADAQAYLEQLEERYSASVEAKNARSRYARGVSAGQSQAVTHIPGIDDITGAVDGEQGKSLSKTAVVPDKTYLQANFPNPFNPSTTVRFGLKDASQVTVRVYDVLGRTVATLVDESLSAGMHEVTWNAGLEASGVYFVRMEAKDFSQTRKMFLLK
jgi:tetratricopeptide (TPR) repeat protein